jgi:hypothetical protein
MIVIKWNKAINDNDITMKQLSSHRDIYFIQKENHSMRKIQSSKKNRYWAKAIERSDNEIKHEEFIVNSIQLRWKNRLRRSQMKKSFSINLHENVVFILLKWKRRTHLTQMKKSFSFNAYEKVVFDQFCSIQTKKSLFKSLFNSNKKAVKSLICVEHSIALITRLRWYFTLDC